MALLILSMTEGACIAKLKMGLAEWRRYKSDGRAQWILAKRVQKLLLIHSRVILD